MIKITRFLYVHFSLAPMLVLSYILGSQMTFFISFGVVLIHELSHLLCAVLLGVEVKSIVILPFGMTIRLSQDLIKCPKKEIMIASAGPLSNILMIVLAQLFFKENIGNLNFYLFLVVNWANLLLNLIPVPPLDGGRIFRVFLIKSSGLMNASHFLQKASRFFIGIILILGIFILILTRGNPSLLIIGAFLIFSLTEEKRTSDLLIMNALINEKEKFKNRSLIPTSTLTINYRTPAHKIVKKLNLSTFYIVYIVDDNLKILKTATESDFIRAVKKNGYRVQSYEV